MFDTCEFISTPQICQVQKLEKVDQGMSENFSYSFKSGGLEPVLINTKKTMSSIELYPAFYEYENSQS